MFAALGRQIHPGLLSGLIDAAEHHLRQLRTGKGADARPRHFAGRTANHKDFSPLQPCRLQQLLGRAIGLAADNAHLLRHLIPSFPGLSQPYASRPLPAAAPAYPRICELSPRSCLSISASALSPSGIPPSGPKLPRPSTALRCIWSLRASLPKIPSPLPPRR